jgi:hypothetical protein
MSCRTLAAALAATLVVAAGCSSTPGGEKECAAYATTVCAMRDRCTANLGVLVRYGYPETCEERETTACLLELRAPGTGVTAEVYASCTAALPTQSCSTFFDNLPIPECASAPGTHAVGKECMSDGQCQTGYCERSSGDLCGACAEFPVADAACPNTGDVVSGLACSKVTHTWVPLGTAGAACDAGYPCASGLVCVGAIPTQQIQGTCESAATAVDATCDPDRQTAADCDRNQGLYCTADNACANITMAFPWEDCGRLLDGSVAMCTFGSVCIFSEGSRQGTCVEAVNDGMTCDSTEGPPCLAPAHCISAAGSDSGGICRLPDPGACG